MNFFVNAHLLEERTFVHYLILDQRRVGLAFDEKCVTCDTVIIVRLVLDVHL